MNAMDYVQLDNLPDIANNVLNILWDRNRRMTLDELVESVNAEFSGDWSKREIRHFTRILVKKDYVERKLHNFTAYYAALGSEEVE